MKKKVSYGVEERDRLVIKLLGKPPAGSAANVRGKFSMEAAEAAVKGVLAELTDGSLPLGDVTNGEIEIMDIRSVVATPWFILTEHKVRFPSPTHGPPVEGTYFRGQFNSGVENGSIAIPITRAGQVVFSKQYRHGPRGWRYVAPQGIRKPNESFEECAKREALEEAGVTLTQDSRVIELGPVEEDGGFCFAKPHVFAITNVQAEVHSIRPDVSESRTSNLLLPFGDMRERIRKGEIRDNATLGALLLAEYNDLLR